MNKRKLESVMKLHGDTYGDLSNHLGIARGTLSNKVNEKNGAEFTQSEIAEMQERYKLTATQICEIFFDSQVS